MFRRTLRRSVGGCSVGLDTSSRINTLARRNFMGCLTGGVGKPRSPVMHTRKRCRHHLRVLASLERLERPMCLPDAPVPCDETKRVRGINSVSGSLRLSPALTSVSTQEEMSWDLKALRSMAKSQTPKAFRSQTNLALRCGRTPRGQVTTTTLRALRAPVWTQRLRCTLLPP